jgi:ppGpp synthetase/RelA/SpoT-type nucleotidyltranferase
MTGNTAPKSGKYIVRITGLDYYDKRTNTRRTAEITEADEMIMQVIPNEFNVNSNIEFEVVKGKRNIFNYDVITDFKPTRIKRVRQRAKITCSIVRKLMKTKLITTQYP